MDAICRRHFQIHLSEWKSSQSDSNFTEVYSQWLNWQYTIIGSYNGLVQTEQATSHYLKQWWLVYRGIYASLGLHDDVIKWKHFPRYWPFVRGIHWSPVNSPHKGQWRGALMFSLICTWINGWANNRETGDLRRHRSYYDVIVLQCINSNVTPGCTRQYQRVTPSLSDINTWTVSRALRHGRCPGNLKHILRRSRKYHNQ